MLEAAARTWSRFSVKVARDGLPCAPAGRLSTGFRHRGARGRARLRIYVHGSEEDAAENGERRGGRTEGVGARGAHARRRQRPSAWFPSCSTGYPEEPVSGTRIGGRTRNLEGKNVLSKMQRTLGPLGVLHECMEIRTRVKVYTRNARGIRGHVEAYVAAFDRHWNLALEDCFEVWTRKVKRKAPALGAPNETRAKEDPAPKVVVRKIERKRETLERHVPQLLLRGEQVAIIVKIN
ncbi:U6 snRNA-associated Sm-like protein LSm11 isoform X1 [Ptiloglossa arizonensis]|uniref:U6 snRNA-associated Sm-like protein LSm11 isoform X1 n=1 Tax=Ptiloglossa arizonensis TaxID=3350558 RepID=UPI003FA095BE